MHCALLTSPSGLKCLDEHASPEDRAQRTADVETPERLGRLKLDTTRSKLECPKCLDERVRRTVGVSTLERLDRLKHSHPES